MILVIFAAIFYYATKNIRGLCHPDVCVDFVVSDAHCINLSQIK